MKATISKRVGLLLSILMAAALVGCSTTPKIDWNSRVGSYTYDQAILEMGPPEQSAKLTDGSVVADWLTQRGYSSGYVGGGYAYSYPYYGYGPILAPYTSYTGPNQYLRLTFDANGKLFDWKKVYK